MSFWKQELYLVCDNIRSLENIGSIFRTAEGTGVNKIFLCGISGFPPNEKISKTALGAEKIVPFEYHKQTWRLLEKLKKKKINIVALEQNKNSLSYDKFKPSFPMALILGNEVRGISKKTLKKSDAIIHLPMFGKKESLNVAVAAGAAIYQIIKYRK